MAKDTYELELRSLQISLENVTGGGTGCACTRPMCEVSMDEVSMDEVSTDEVSIRLVATCS